MEKIVKLSVETFTNDPLETHPFSLLFSLKLYSYGGGGGWSDPNIICLPIISFVKEKNKINE